MNATSVQLGKVGAAADRVDADRLAAVLATVGRDSLERLLKECRHRLETATGDLRRAEVAGNRSYVLAALHKLQGSCGSLGLKGLAEALRRTQSDLSIAEDRLFRSICIAASLDVEDLIKKTWSDLPTDASLDCPG